MRKISILMVAALAITLSSCGTISELFATETPTPTPTSTVTPTPTPTSTQTPTVTPTYTLTPTKPPEPGLGISREEVITFYEGRGYTFEPGIPQDDGKEQFVGELPDGVGSSRIEIIGPAHNVYSISILAFRSLDESVNFFNALSIVGLTTLLTPEWDTNMEWLLAQLEAADSGAGDYEATKTIDHITYRVSANKELDSVVFSAEPTIE